MRSRSMGSQIALMDQNMIDLVDGLIDASPDNQIHKSEQKDFAQNFSSQINSFGFLKYQTGDTYEGSFLNGKRTGKGKMVFSNGDIYYGNWKLDFMCDDEGLYIFRNGNEYRGSIKNN